MRSEKRWLSRSAGPRWPTGWPEVQSDPELWSKRSLWTNGSTRVNSSRDWDASCVHQSAMCTWDWGRDSPMCPIRPSAMTIRSKEAERVTQNTLCERWDVKDAAGPPSWRHVHTQDSIISFLITLTLIIRQFSFQHFHLIMFLPHAEHPPNALLNVSNTPPSCVPCSSLGLLPSRRTYRHGSVVMTSADWDLVRPATFSLSLQTSSSHPPSSLPKNSHPPWLKKISVFKFAFL